MKKIALLFAATMLLICTDVSAAKLKYAASCGKKNSTIVFDTSIDGQYVKLVVTNGNQVQYQTFDSDYNTLDWHIVDPDIDSDVTVSREKGKFRVKGKYKGKDIDRSVEDKGFPWYQHIGYCGGHVLKNSTTTFVCVRPTDMEIFQMQVTPQGRTEFGGAKPVRLKVTPAGVLAKLWSSDYYYDPETLDFFGYQAVEGAPGTPVTTWILVR